MTEVPDYHVPALLTRTIEGLGVALHPDGTFVDATLGGAGHSRAILSALGPTGRLVSFDRDRDAIARAPLDDPRLTVVHGNFRFMANYLQLLGIDLVDGILADLGVSFHHFDTPERGFSFRADGPLDMRMNQDGGMTAAQILESLSTDSLTDILRRYGELPRAASLARAIEKAAPITTVAGLIAAVEPLMDPRRRKKELACLFQALRIAVNDEAGALEALLTNAPKLLRPGGRLAVLTYHSLEDRMVKNVMRTGRLDGRRTTDLFGNVLTPWRVLTPKAITADADEVARNPRSRSAKLRIAELIPQEGERL